LNNKIMMMPMKITKKMETLKDGIMRKRDRMMTVMKILSMTRMKKKLR